MIKIVDPDRNHAPPFRGSRVCSQAEKTQPGEGQNCVADVESLRCNATVALHDDEIPIDVDLVRELVAASFPAYAPLKVWPLDQTGSSNRLFRLGDDLLVRLPRQRGGSSTLGKEQRWVPKVAPGLAVAVPQVIGVGEPGFGYPEQWSITQWLPGSTPRVGRSGGSALVEGLADRCSHTMNPMQT